MGAGYHGGFGATKGSALKILPSAGSTPAIKINVSKQDIINALRGVTDMSTLIAENIENKNIGINILGDKLFEAVLGKTDNPEVINGFQMGRNVYIRRSAITGYSIFVHEGTHALDSVNGVPQHQIGSHQGEFKAFANEHDYQIKKGEKPDFKDYDDILVHIKINYK